MFCFAFECRCVYGIHKWLCSCSYVCGRVCMCTGMWRCGVSIRYLPGSLSILFTEAGSLAESGAHRFSSSSSPACLGDPAFASWVLGSRWATMPNSFYGVLVIRTLVLTLARRALSPRSRFLAFHPSTVSSVVCNPSRFFQFHLSLSRVYDFPRFYLKFSSHVICLGPTTSFMSS